MSQLEDLLGGRVSEPPEPREEHQSVETLTK